MSVKLTVVMADDHPIFSQGLRQVIQAGCPCHLYEALDGRAALRLIEEKQPTLCILDVAMPHLDGLGVVRQMRQQGLSSEVIFLTMHKEREIFIAAMELGVKGYVLKDCAVVEITDCIQSVISGRHYISPALSDLLVARQAGAPGMGIGKQGIDRLTHAETRILRLISQDKTSKEIAVELGLSTRTVENHRANICAKLDLHGIHSLVKFAFDQRDRLPFQTSSGPLKQR